MKFGICGYGNLGRAVERLIDKTDRDEIVGIFSRRNNVKSDFSHPVYLYDDAEKFEGKIDAMLMCGGSQEDLLWQSPDMLKYFDIIDTFDTHARIELHKSNLEKMAKRYGHTAIYSCGWDPGLFSLIRTLASNIFEQPPQTFWGKGVSQGHSEALRNIRGVSDAIQFTFPNKGILNAVKKDATYFPKENDKHERHCYISLDGTRDESEIFDEINKTENYFKGQKVSIEVCTLQEIKKLKKKVFHQGIVLGGDKNSSLDFHVKMNNNPDFTAKVLVAYSRALPKMKSGAYSVLDVPIGMIGREDNKSFI